MHDGWTGSIVHLATSELQQKRPKYAGKFEPTTKKIKIFQPNA